MKERQNNKIPKKTNKNWKGKHPSKRFSSNADRNNDSNQSKDTSSKDTSYRISSLNDVSWYTRYPELSVGTASIPYPFRPGMSVPITPEFNQYPDVYGFTIPGVMAFEWMPSFGYSSQASDPASVVGREMYGKIRKSFSSTLSVGAPDLVMYIGALDSIYAYIGLLKRTYRIVSCYSPDNFMLPNGILKALGFKDTEITQLLSDRSRLYAIINELVLMSRKFTCPSGMDIMNRHYWMCDNVYTDAPYVNSQMYVFSMRSVYKFTLVEDSRGVMVGGLTNHTIPWLGNDPIANVVERMFSFGRELIDALSAWEDAYTINGYLMRAYEGIPNFVVDLLNVDETLVPVYVPEVLLQIRNMRVLPMSASSIDTSVGQDVVTNAILCNPSFEVPSTGVNAVWYTNYGDIDICHLSVDSPAPTVGDTLIATRLKWAWRTVTDAVTIGYKKFSLYTGTELVTGTRLIYRIEQNPYTAYTEFEVTTVLNGTESPGADSLNTDVARVAQFGDHPMLWVRFLNAELGATYGIVPMFDLKNVTTLDNDELGRIHRVCIYSELNAFSQ